MQNMSFEDFFPWLKTTEYKGPIGLTTKYYVKDDKVSKFCEIMKNHVAFAKAQVGVRHYKLHAHSHCVTASPYRRLQTP